MKRKHTKYIYEGGYVAQVEVELIDGNGDWSPYLSLEDVRRLDAVRLALRTGDLQRAAKSAQVYTLTPVAA